MKSLFFNLESSSGDGDGQPGSSPPRRGPCLLFNKTLRTDLHSAPLAPLLNHQNRALPAAATAEPSTSSASASATPNPSNIGRASDASSSTDTYAVVEIGGVQLLLEEGRWYSTDRLAASAGSTLALGRVLAVKKDGKFSVGTPYVEGAQVEAVVLEDDALGDKQVVFKFHSKKHYRRKTGHRQPLTKFMVTKIA